MTEGDHRIWSNYTHADTESMKRASNIFRDAIKKQA